MKYFWDFIDFIIMQELKQPDSIVRNYSIETDRAGKPIYPSLKCDQVRLGLTRMGFQVRKETAHTCFSELLAALRGLKCYIDDVFIMAHLAHFYNYHRIKKGELNTWKKRTVRK